MFHFLQYVSPTWYYRLAHQSTAAVLIDYDLLSAELLELVELDTAYITEQAIRLDAAYQGLIKGIIPNEEQCITDPAEKEPVENVLDNYRFLRKYYGTHWYVYVFILRLLSFHNPFRETSAFIKNLFVKRKPLYPDQKVQQRALASFDRYDSKLLRAQPLVSVIIPTLNRYDYLKDVLADLEQQDYPNFEVLICDQTAPVNHSFYEGWSLDIRLIPQEEKALWLARNRCIQEAKGAYILLFDDDSRVEADWIAQHLKALDYHKVNISAGVTDTLVGGGLSQKSAYFHFSDVFDTGNAMVHKEVFHNVGLFDRQFEKQRMGDGEFGLRAFLNGYRLISNPGAKRIHLKVGTGGLRQMGSWDAFRPKSLLAPRPIPSVLYLSRKYFGNSSSVFWLLITVPPSLIPYKWKRNKRLRLLGMMTSFLLFPLLLIPVMKSWRSASKKLQEGDRIGHLI